MSKEEKFNINYSLLLDMEKYKKTKYFAQIFEQIKYKGRVR